ncbi:MAG: YaeQ family protein [Verrucomicrobiales bacterium]|nr:YaeQ family protein [Verrucomicrobiales bacterium]
MSDRLVFNVGAMQGRTVLPSRLVFVRRETETRIHILLKLFGLLLFQRERLEIEPHIDDPFMPFVPDLAQFDYQGRIALWVECGECAISKLDRLAVKAPDAEIWVVRRSAEAAGDVLQRMAQEGLRRARYGVVGMDAAMLEEVEQLCVARNDVVWHRASWQDQVIQFEFNGLWFDCGFTVGRH